LDLGLGAGDFFAVEFPSAASLGELLLSDFFELQQK
jgi:hypothetical protein